MENKTVLLNVFIGIFFCYNTCSRKVMLDPMYKNTNEKTFFFFIGNALVTLLRFPVPRSVCVCVLGFLIILSILRLIL